MKLALCVGINDYPGTYNDLEQCVSDAYEWRSLLIGQGFEVTVITDSDATRENVSETLYDMLARAGSGDVVVFTYSGHGTYEYDYSGDEPDNYDEALCLYDGNLLDDELRTILDSANNGTHVSCFIDSCFSGTITRASMTGRPKFMEPVTKAPMTAKPKKRFLADEDMLEVLMTGCDEDEYSYETDEGGAFTQAAVTSFEPSITYRDWYDRIREKLPSPVSPQTPQLEGAQANFARIAFQQSASDEEDDEPIAPTWVWITLVVVVLGSLLLIFLL